MTESKRNVSILMVVLGVLAVGMFILGAVFINHNNKLHSFKTAEDTFSHPYVNFSPYLTEVLKSDDVVIHDVDYEDFLKSFWETTGIPVFLEFTTSKDIDFDFSKSQKDEEFTKYCNDHLNDVFAKTTEGKQDYLYIIVCFEDAYNTHISFVPGDLVLIDYAALDDFYKIYNTEIGKDNYKYSAKAMNKALDAFKTYTVNHMTSNVDNGQCIGVYKNASDLTQEQLDGISGKYIRYNKDDKADKVLTIDHQIYYEYSDKLISKPILVLVFALGFIFCIADVFLVIKFYGENKK